MLQGKVGKCFMDKSVVVFDGNALAKLMFNNIVPIQTNLLIEYAKVEIKKLGDRIASYNGANGLDRTGNLLNSLCWGVTYDGKLMEGGFYRNETHKTRTNRWGQVRGLGVSGGNESYLHEFFRDDAEEVDGRKLALQYLLSKHGKRNKWTMFFAILAPYWGYWEGGFRMVKTNKRMQFQALIYTFDDVRKDLKPAKTDITIYRPKYQYRKRKFKNKVGIKKIGVSR